MVKRQERSKAKSVRMHELEKFARHRGADLLGIADLGRARDFIASQGPSWVAEFPLAISMGMELCHPIIDHHSPDEPRDQSLYFHHYVEVVTRALDFLAYDVARWLFERGFNASPVPASSPWDSGSLKGIFSHKLAAHLAGLGWIGKSCLFLSSCFGPRVRLVTVLTDAPLKAGTPLDQPCGKCHVCIDVCPVKAFTGVEFRPEEDREVRFEFSKCHEYRHTHACGLCVTSCPKGRRLAVQRRVDSKGSE